MTENPYDRFQMAEGPDDRRRTSSWRIPAVLGRRRGRRVIRTGSVLAVSTALVAVAPAAAAADTWSGTWNVVAQGTATLTLQQTGDTISGAFSLQGTSAGLSSTSLSGNALDADFGGDGLTGHLHVSISGTTLSGSYTANLLGVSASGSLSGTCVAGPCLSNGGSAATPPSPGPAAPGEPSVPLTPVQAEQQILDALAEGNVANLPELRERDDEFGRSLASMFFSAARTDPETATDSLLQIAGQLSEAEDANGVPLYPSVTAMLPVILRMAGHAVHDPDPQSRQSFATASARLVALLVKYDTAFGAGATPPATPNAS